MKPLLILSEKLWCCFCPDWPITGIVGLGFDPEQAYSDWWEMTRSKWKTEVAADSAAQL